MRTVRLLISGRVQGVGYRDWMVGEARRLGCSGWVRNRGDSQVEAVVQGDEAAVAAMIAACHEGPRHGRVDFVTESPADFVESAAFSRFPSV